MRRPLPVRERGLSLIELLLALAITAVVLAPLVPMLATASNAARIGGDQLAVEREADFALERIAARIRAKTTTLAHIIGSSCDQDLATPVLYKVSNGVLSEKQGEDSHDLASSVSCITFDTLSSSTGQTLVKVSLSLVRNDASTAATAVVPLGVAPGVVP